MVAKAVRESIDQPDGLVGASEQQRAAVRADRPDVKRRDHATAFDASDLPGVFRTS